MRRLLVWHQTSGRYEGPAPASSWETPEGGRWHRRWRVYRARPPFALGHPRLLRRRRGVWRTVLVRRPGPIGYVARGYVGLGPA